MAGYLAVTDEMTLTPAGVGVIAKDFPRRSEVSQSASHPAYSGTNTKAHSWVAPFYNQESPVVSEVRGMIASAQYTGEDVHIVHIGDSKTNGSGPNEGKAYVHGYPSIFRRMLGAVDGAITAEITGSQWDDRWTATNLRAPYVSGQIGLVPIMDNPGPFAVTFAPGFDHAGGTWWINAQTGATVTVTVDGGAPQPITVPAGNGLHPVTPTVTGTSKHTYRLDTPDKVHVATFAPAYDGPRLKVTRLGRGGSTPAEWKPGYRADRTGLWDTFLTTAADAVVVGLGTNGTQGAVNVADLTAVYSGAVGLGIPVVAIAPGGLGGTGGLKPLTDYHPMYQSLWDAADRHNLPLIDFQSIIGDWPTATAAGLLADVVHESKTGYAYEAAALRALFT